MVRMNQQNRSIELDAGLWVGMSLCNSSKNQFDKFIRMFYHGWGYEILQTYNDVKQAELDFKTMDAKEAKENIAEGHGCRFHEGPTGVTMVLPLN